MVSLKKSDFLALVLLFGLVPTFIGPSTALAAKDKSCMELACEMGHCKFSTDTIAKACADAVDSCVVAICKSAGDCRYESDFVRHAKSCSRHHKGDDSAD
jgi:hypothetical protein